ncbi:MAG: hypothetical protein GY696_11140 [Gammaproteobacteria bacterium]|nr:hypothetical protein [Gammaproteobacteria bacterium]
MSEIRKAESKLRIEKSYQAEGGIPSSGRRNPSKWKCQDPGKRKEESYQAAR